MATNFYVDLPPSGGSSGVSSLNSLTGAITLTGSGGITLTPTGNTIDISGSGGGGSPGGSNHDVQYNSSGSFAGNNTFQYDGTNITFTGAILDGSAVSSLVPTNRQAQDSNGLVSLNWDGREGLDTAGNACFLWGSRILVDENGNIALNWNVGSRLLYDDSQIPSHDYGNRVLYALNGGTPNLNYNNPNRILLASAADDLVTSVQSGGGASFQAQQYGPSAPISLSTTQFLGSGSYICNGQTIEYLVVAYGVYNAITYYNVSTTFFTDTVNDGVTNFAVGLNWLDGDSGNGNTTGFEVATDSGISSFTWENVTYALSDTDNGSFANPGGPPASPTTFNQAGYFNGNVNITGNYLINGANAVVWSNASGAIEPVVSGNVVIGVTDDATHALQAASINANGILVSEGNGGGGFQAGGGDSAGASSISIGSAACFDDFSVSIGNSAQTQLGGASVSIGRQASSIGGNNVAIGNVAQALETGGIAIGAGAQVPSGSTSGIALGASTSTAGFSNAIAIGVGLTSTASNQVMLGGTSFRTLLGIPTDDGVTTLQVTGNQLLSGVIVDNLGAQAASIDPNTRFLKDSSGDFSIDWGNRKLYDGASLSLDYFNRILADNFAVNSVDWTARHLFDSTDVLSIDYESRQLLDTGAVLSEDWSARKLYAADGSVQLAWNLSGEIDIAGILTAYPGGPGQPIVNVSVGDLVDNSDAVSLTWVSRILYDSTGTVTSIDWQNRLLDDSAGNTSANYQNRILFDSVTHSSIDWDQRLLYLTNGLDVSVDWGNGILKNPTNAYELDWVNGLIKSAFGSLAIDWPNHLLYTQGGSPSLDWDNRLLKDSASHTAVDYQNRLLISANGTTTLIDYSNNNSLIYTPVGTGTGTALVLTGANTILPLTSSARFKEEVREERSFAGANLKAANYHRKGSETSTRETGLIAEEAYEVIPEIVNLDQEGKPYSINMNAAIAVLFDKVAELEKKLTEANEQLAKLKPTHLRRI